ncbi:RNA-binding protein 44-like isoform X3 [Varanus komodoensis]|uniref:RNA-binding protein 44-like isoform X3 n=1 Tax=Varanus komodoensis TaxID=61221 RepID=UPI001CF7C610|nr:RNA-binding protein 44-like isoform X3 [Varanus komodoensis]
MEQRESGVEKGAGSTGLNTHHEPAHSKKNKVENISSELQAGTNCSISHQSVFLNASQLKSSKATLFQFSPLLDEELEFICKKQQDISITLEDANETVNLDSGTDFFLFRDSENDEYKCSDLDDDSQLEYHSAEEQDYVSCNSFKQETETSETFQNTELANEDRLVDGQHSSNELEAEFSTSGYSIVGEGDNYSKIAEFPQVFQDCKCQCLNYDQEKDEASSMFYSIVNEDSFSTGKERNTSIPFSVSKTKIDEKMEVNSSTNIALKSLMATNKSFCKRNDYNATGVFQKTGNPHALHQEQTPLHSHLSCGDSEVSDSYVHNQSIIVNANKTCVYKSYSHHGRCQDAKLKYIPCLNNTASKNQSTVNQAVDATSDFRACFTTSRATNVKASVVSRAQNTVITMMSKRRPKEWLMDSHKSVACNTDWSCLPGNVEMTNSETVTVDTLENCIANNTAKCGWTSDFEGPLEWKNSTSREVNEIPNRMMQLSKEITDHLPNCCKGILQRAIKAEMQLLKFHYQMYHQCCSQTSKTLMEEKEHLKSSVIATGTSVSQVSQPQNMKASLPLVTHQMSENSDFQLWPSNKNSEEKKKDLVENSSSDTQESREDWFDATENLTVTDSSLSHKLQSLLIGTAETQTTKDRKKESKKIYCVHVGGLSPLVSESDLWLHFEKYNVSQILIREYSDSYRYASLTFKAASDAKIAVKEMNEKEIKGKAVKVRLVKTVRENGDLDHHSLVKQEHETQRQNNIEYRKNCDLTLEVPASVSAASKIPAGSPIFSKGSDVSTISLKSSLLNGPRSQCASAPSEVVSHDSRSSSRNICFEIEQEIVSEGLLPLGSVQFIPNPSATFIPPNALNLRSFRKVVKNLEELHPEISRDNILDALVETKENKGLFSGLPLSTIVEMTSSLLKKKFALKSEGKNRIEKQAVTL